MSSDIQDHPQLQPWDRRRQESAVAYRAFVAYRDLGAERTFVATAQALDKCTSLVRRWAARYGWRDRVWAWEVAQAHEAEQALRREREQSLQRQLHDANQLERLAMARFASLVQREPQSGELTLDPKVSPRDALAILRFAVEQQDRLAQTQAAAAPPAEDLTERQLKRMTTQQLHELLALARERSEQKGDDGDDDSKDDGIFSSGDQHEQEEPNEEGRSAGPV